MDYLPVPDSNIRLYDGSVVMLANYPGVTWVIHNGYYSYNGRQYQGWYFLSIPSQTILPVNNDNLRLVTVISNPSSEDYPDCPFPPYPPGPPVPPPGPQPCPPGPSPSQTPFTREDKKHLDAAFISVSTLKKRDELDTSRIPDGKIVRVNSVDGESKYYVWSAFNDHWEDFDIAFKEDIEDTRPIWEIE